MLLYLLLPNKPMERTFKTSALYLLLMWDLLISIVFYPSTLYPVDFFGCSLAGYWAGTFVVCSGAYDMYL